MPLRRGSSVAADHESFVAEQATVDCRRFAARLTPQGCANYRAAHPADCAGCASGPDEKSPTTAKAVYGRGKARPKSQIARPVEKPIKLTLAFVSADERGDLRRLHSLASKNKTTVEDEIMIMISACLDYYGVK